MVLMVAACLGISTVSLMSVDVSFMFLQKQDAAIESQDVPVEK